MASGKSLELAKIGRKAPSALCKCGAPWSDHLRKDGKVLAKYDNDKHGTVTSETAYPISRGARRRMLKQARRG